MARRGGRNRIFNFGLPYPRSCQYHEGRTVFVHRCISCSQHCMCIYHVLINVYRSNRRTNHWEAPFVWQAPSWACAHVITDPPESLAAIITMIVSNYVARSPSKRCLPGALPLSSHGARRHPVTCMSSSCRSAREEAESRVFDHFPKVTHVVMAEARFKHRLLCSR